jgi:hypothetical protein
MRRLVQGIVISLVGAALLLSVVGCGEQPEKAQVEATNEGSQDLVSMIHVADPATSVQLLKGFHNVEQNSWRWTMQQFSVALRPPAGAAEKGAILQLELSIPDPVIQRLKSITLTANVDGTALAGETYTRPGEHLYRREVPAEALKREAATVDFALDKVLPPGELDRRELGVVVTVVGFEAK